MTPVPVDVALHVAAHSVDRERGRRQLPRYPGAVVLVLCHSL
jgi:hypothetical protein